MAVQEHPASSQLEPEMQLIIAVYLQARRDLRDKSKRLRTQARLFFEADGWDVSKIEAGLNGRKTSSR